MKIAAFHGMIEQKRGAERAFVNMIAALSKRKHEVSVFALSISPEYEKKLNECGVKTTAFGFREWYTGFSVFDAYLRLVNELRALLIYMRLLKQLAEYDVVFTHHFNYSPLMNLLSKKPTVYYCHEPPRQYYEREQAKNTLQMLARALKYPAELIDCMLDRICVRKVAFVLSNSNYTRGYITQVYGVKTVTNYLGVDAEKFKPLNIQKEDMVLSVGALHPKKAHDFVIKSIGLLKEKPRLMIVGSGPEQERQRLIALAREKNVVLEVKSNIPDEELIMLYNKARVNLMAYVNEPSIEPEALACSTPIVAVDEGGASETLKEAGGVLTPRDEAKFVEAVEDLLKNPGKAKAIGEYGRHWIMENFTWDKCAERLEVYFKEALSTSRK